MGNKQTAPATEDESIPATNSPHRHPTHTSASAILARKLDSTSIAGIYSYLHNGDINAAMQVCREWKLDHTGFSLLTKMRIGLPSPDCVVDGGQDQSLPNEYFLRSNRGPVMSGPFPCIISTPWRQECSESRSIHVIVRLHISEGSIAANTIEEGTAEMFQRQPHRVMNVLCGALGSRELFLQIRQWLEGIQAAALSAEEQSAASSTCATSTTVPLIFLTILDGSSSESGSSDHTSIPPMIALSKTPVVRNSAPKPAEQKDEQTEKETPTPSSSKKAVKATATKAVAKSTPAVKSKSMPADDDGVSVPPSSSSSKPDPPLPLLFQAFIARTHHFKWLCAFIAFLRDDSAFPRSLEMKRMKPVKSPPVKSLRSRLHEAASNGGPLTLLWNFFVHAPAGCTSDSALETARTIMQVFADTRPSPKFAPDVCQIIPSHHAFDGLVIDVHDGVPLVDCFKLITGFRNSVLGTLVELYLVGITHSRPSSWNLLRSSSLFPSSSGANLLYYMSTIALVAHSHGRVQLDDGSVQELVSRCSHFLKRIYLDRISFDSPSILHIPVPSLRRLEIVDGRIGPSNDRVDLVRHIADDRAADAD